MALHKSWPDDLDNELAGLASGLELVSAVDLTDLMKLLLAVKHPFVKIDFDMSTNEGAAQFVEWFYTILPDKAGGIPGGNKQIEWANHRWQADWATPISRLMYLLWLRRPDLQQAFDLSDEGGRLEYCRWFVEIGVSEFKLDHRLVPTSVRQLTRVRKSPFAPVVSAFRRLMGHAPDVAPGSRAPGKNTSKSVASIEKPLPVLDSAALRAVDDALAGGTGVGIIGNFTGDYGIAQHARNVAESMRYSQIDTALINVQLGPHQQTNILLAERFQTTNPHGITLQCINPPSALEVLAVAGADNILGKHNIVYGYWELARCPQAWKQYVELFDEVWAPTKFIADAFAGFTDLPVVHMPIAVSVEKAPWIPRRQQGLPEGKFLFLFHFDGFSFSARKNPEACVRAFKSAFAADDQSAALVIKVKQMQSEALDSLTSVIDNDPRIILIPGDFTRAQIIGLEMACDAYISLHRSEGFGFGPAEMMYLGKPVIVTGYSGNLDFTNADNSCLVDYKLIDVKPGEYVHYEAGQQWADPDIEQAGWYMRKLVDDAAYRTQIGEAGRRTIMREHSPARIGERYADRLKALGARPR
jgi:glycosyltransferase involved in cell wall biosynthesis